MEHFFNVMAVVITIIIVIPIWRVLKGPTNYDRLLGAAAVATKTIVLICLIGYLFDREEMILDIALAYALLNFIGTIVIAKFLGTERARQ